MKSFIERPYPFEFIHPNGEKLKIDFIWGDALSRSPIGLTVWHAKDEMPVKIGEEFGAWLTYAEARARSLIFAEGCFKEEWNGQRLGRMAAMTY